MKCLQLYSVQADRFLLPPLPVRHSHAVQLGKHVTRKLTRLLPTHLDRQEFIEVNSCPSIWVGIPICQLKAQCPPLPLWCIKGKPKKYTDLWLRWWPGPTLHKLTHKQLPGHDPSKLLLVLDSHLENDTQYILKKRLGLIDQICWMTLKNISKKSQNTWIGEIGF